MSVSKAVYVFLMLALVVAGISFIVLPRVMQDPAWNQGFSATVPVAAPRAKGVAEPSAEAQGAQKIKEQVNLSGDVVVDQGFSLTRGMGDLTKSYQRFLDDLF